MKDRCAQTGKVAYKSKAKARQALIAMQSRGFGHGLQGIYRCPECGRFHATSRYGYKP